ncbi:hypothetical protein ACN6MY_07645 [Peribacillus sp. B-H-3]|jgi:hypothetical protein|uniref:hypothetical protein n=1 Tax=Peribacillus sp. B-H-3 TaxID=3400420 RepID=UPI003B0119E0
MAAKGSAEEAFPDQGPCHCSYLKYAASRFIEQALVQQGPNLLGYIQASAFFKRYLLQVGEVFNKISTR